jgi:hypothetical protein
LMHLVRLPQGTAGETWLPTGPKNLTGQAVDDL